MKALAIICLATVSLAAIGWGLWLVYEPAAFIGVGALIWLDLMLWGWLSARQPKAAKVETHDGSAKK